MTSTASAVGPIVDANIPQGAVEDRSGLLKGERAFVEKSLDQGSAVAALKSAGLEWPGSVGFCGFTEFCSVIRQSRQPAPIATEEC
jgi:hypothetical protein